MTTTSTTRKPRADVLRNRATLLNTAQRHFLAYGVDTSLDAIAKEAGVGAGTLYRHFPTREALLAAVLQTRWEELKERQEAIEQLENPAQALQEWLWALEDYFCSFNGLPEPLVEAAQAAGSDSKNPLAASCQALNAVTDRFLLAAQQEGYAKLEVTGQALFLAVASLAWLRGKNCPDSAPLLEVRRLIDMGYKVREG